MKEVVAKPTKIEVLNEFSLSGLREMSGEEYGYCEYWCYGVESVKGQPFWKAWYKWQWNFIYSFTFFGVKMRFFPANMDYQKKYFPSSLPSSKLTISLISIYKHTAIDIADPNSMQDGYHELRNRPRSPWSVCGSVVEHWGWNWKVWASIPHGINPKQFFLCPMLLTRRKKTSLSMDHHVFEDARKKSRANW